MTSQYLTSFTEFHSHETSVNTMYGSACCCPSVLFHSSIETVRAEPTCGSCCGMQQSARCPLLSTALDPNAMSCAGLNTGLPGSEEQPSASGQMQPLRPLPARLAAADPFQPAGHHMSADATSSTSHQVSDMLLRKYTKNWFFTWCILDYCFSEGTLCESCLHTHHIMHIMCQTGLKAGFAAVT